MTEELIEKYCKNCDKCICERNAVHHFYPYSSPEEFVPAYCGEITEDGGNGISLKELEHCMKEIKIGEKYQLKQDKDYFCIDLQRLVKFMTPVCVEVVGEVTGNLSDPDRLYFGKLISTGSVGADYVSENEIEFVGDDVVDVYTMKKMTIFYLEPYKD